MADAPRAAHPAADVPLDAALVARAQRGDHAAFTAIVERLHPRALRFARRLLGGEVRESAEDVVQDTWGRVLRALPRYDEAHPFESWFFTILANRCRSAARRHLLERRWVAPIDDDAPADGVVDPTARLDAQAATAQVQRLLDALPAEQREAFLLRHVEQLSYEEIAAVTGAGVSACKMRVKRATDALRARLGEGRA